MRTLYPGKEVSPLTEGRAKRSLWKYYWLKMMNGKQVSVVVVINCRIHYCGIYWILEDCMSLESK